MNIDLFFYEHPVFRYKEFVIWKAEQGTTHPHSINMAIQYYLKAGRIKRLHREVYAVIPPN